MPAHNQPTIEIDEDVFLPRYLPLLESEADINFLWGGRDSGKSVFVAQKLLLECLKPQYFRCILVRKVFEDIKDSQWQLLFDWAVKWGIDQFFQFKSSPLEIVCLLNGNKFICRGCDKPSKLKSISGPSHTWYEEGNQLTAADYTTISTTLRSDDVRVQEWFSFNPECVGDYEDFWLYKTYFKDQIEKGKYNFVSTHTMDIPGGGKVQLKYVSVHVTYQDNPYVTPERIARHELLKQTNPYFYKVFTLGQWGRQQSGGEFYKCYSAAKHIGKVKYDTTLPIHMAWDFNVNPYITCTIWQVKGKRAGLINEILLSHPRNTDLAVCSEFERLYPGHKAGLFIYGDPGGLKQSTADDTTVRVKEKDYSEFNKILTTLRKYMPELRVPRAYPAVKLRGNFINTIFEAGFGGIEIVLDESCKRSQAEFANLKEASDGTKHKEMYKDEITQVQCQKWGHISDSADYFLTSAFETEFYEYQSGGYLPTIHVGKHVSKNKW